jgi:hypothetical protein
MSESEARMISILGDPEPLRALRTRHFLGPPGGLPELEGNRMAHLSIGTPRMARRANKRCSRSPRSW